MVSNMEQAHIGGPIIQLTKALGNSISSMGTVSISGVMEENIKGNGKKT